jgi:hypothetical protein
MRGISGLVYGTPQATDGNMVHVSRNSIEIVPLTGERNSIYILIYPKSLYRIQILHIGHRFYIMIKKY